MHGKKGLQSFTVSDHQLEVKGLSLTRLRRATVHIYTVQPEDRSKVFSNTASNLTLLLSSVKDSSAGRIESMLESLAGGFCSCGITLLLSSVKDTSAGRIESMLESLAGGSACSVISG